MSLAVAARMDVSAAHPGKTFSGWLSRFSFLRDWFAMKSLLLPLSALALLGLLLTCPDPEGPPSLALEAQPAAPQPVAPPSSPVRVPLTVKETAGVARAGEMVRSGIPLPRSLGVRDVRALAIDGPGGKPVAAEFRVLARWNAGKDDGSAPVQWLLVTFPATVGAKGSAVYHLVSGSPNPPPPSPLRLTRDGRQVIVDTGAAVFRLGKEAGTLFDEIALPDGRKVVSGGALALRAAGRDGGHSTIRDVRVESAGPLSAAVVVDGVYDHPPVGQGRFGSRRRYVFTAGSSVVQVRHAVAWEGNLDCPGCTKTQDGKPNAVLVERVRDELALGLEGPLSVAAVGDFRAPALEKGLAGDGERTVWVRQTLRERRTSPLRFEAVVAGERRQGDEADGGVLAASVPNGSVAVALNHMHRYEPQSLRLLDGGRLAVDLVDGKTWLANHQGLFASFAVAVSAAPAKRPELDRQLWAPLNHPLRAWPDAAWFNDSKAVDEVASGPLPRQLADYDKLIPAVLRRTVEGVKRDGLSGVTTFGVYPRYWGENGSPGEIECKDDPTPGETWDDLFWCGAWTDYHNTVATAAIWAMRSGEVEWLDEISFPGALRTLHTQILQCSSEEEWFYCGQSPLGYGAYRADFNSSHAYFENLFLYYWLTGDSTVVDTLRRGGDSMRRWLCPTRGPSPVKVPKGPDGPACPPTRVPESPDAVLTGRVAYQWTAAFRFLGLASEDASFLEDYRSNLARAVTLQYAELEQGGRRYGFLGDKPLTTPGTGEAGPTWTNGFYDAENLYRFQLDTGDAPIGEPPLTPSRVLAAVARTLVELGAGRFGDGTPEGLWPRLLAYTWSGPRIGGVLQKVETRDRELYNPEKYGTVALLARAGRQTGDPVLVKAGDQMIRAILRQAKGDILPLGKIQGQTLTRLHAAVAVAAEEPPPSGQ